MLTKTTRRVIALVAVAVIAAAAIAVTMFLKPNAAPALVGRDIRDAQVCAEKSGAWYITGCGVAGCEYGCALPGEKRRCDSMGCEREP